MNIEDDFLWVAGNAFSEMRLLVEGAITLFEDDAGVLCRLAREAQKNEAQLALNTAGFDVDKVSHELTSLLLYASAYYLPKV